MEDLINKLKVAIIEGDEEEALKVTKELLERGIDPKLIIERALEPAMKIVGEKFEREEYFIPEVMLAAEVFKKVMEFLKPHLGQEVGEKSKGRVVIGTVRGDIHELGKNLVATMLSVAGFEVIDLGVDVSPEKFIEAVEKYRPDVLGLSALMTTTMIEQKVVIEELKRRGLRDKVKVIVGGAPVTEEWAREIGADGYAANAYEAVRLVKKLLGVE
ncbi:MAG: cobalamin-binding protein [Thermoprotei archaeon]|nr:MAG: cobalamin-binding protein [Thermoprotei archaeon]